MFKQRATTTPTPSPGCVPRVVSFCESGPGEPTHLRIREDFPNFPVPRILRSETPGAKFHHYQYQGGQ